MTVLQHYYTSFVNRENGSAGFQVKAMSLDIPAEIQAMILRLIAYRIPSTLNEHEIARHPIALRYYYIGHLADQSGMGEVLRFAQDDSIAKDDKSPLRSLRGNAQTSILLCSQSSGKDENGRPGNFFAHTLVMEPDIFTSVPPILYWRSPIWRSSDPESRTVLPTLDSFEIEPELSIEQVWDFLRNGDRSEWFYTLMCAVVHSHKNQRRIVIIDTPDTVALWIAAVSCMLPPDYRPLLTFATYHHDPYQAQFLITGTTSDSSFRAAPEEYVTYFILNAETGMKSDIEDSLYARMVTSAANPEQYEEKLLPFFTDSMRRFPKPEVIDEQLDLMALYFDVMRQKGQTVLGPDELKSISLALSVFEQLETFDEDDVKDLRRLRKVLSTAFRSLQGQNPLVTTEYRRATRLWKMHGVTTEDDVVEELKHFTGLLVREEPNALDRITSLRQIYSDNMFETAVNTPSYLKLLNSLSSDMELRSLLLVWQEIGPYIQPCQESWGLLQRSLILLGRLWNTKQSSKESKALSELIIQGIVGRELEWLKLATIDYTSLPQEALERFYSKLVHPLDLEQRSAYRDIVLKASQDIILYELLYDMVIAGSQKSLAVLQRYVDYARQWNPGVIPSLLRQGLAQLNKTSTAEQWCELASVLLTSSTLAPLPEDWEDSLINTTLSSISFSRFSPADIEVCKKYQNHPGLSDDTRTVIAGLLAMSSGNMEEEVANRLHLHFKDLRPEIYSAEVHRFIVEFFKNCITKESHDLMFTALFTWKYSDHFWQPYWGTFKKMLTNVPTISQAVDVLSFWFTTFKNPFHRYVVQCFLLELPHILAEARRMHGFQDAAPEIHAQAAKHSWYPLIQDHLTGRKNALHFFGQNLAQGVAIRFHKHVSHAAINEVEAKTQAEQELKQTQMLEAKVSNLFKSKPIAQSHAQILPGMYSQHQRQQFWASYWQKFAALLTSNDPEQVLDLFSFWFNDSLDALEQMPYIPQDFFLGLYAVLDSLQKAHGFRETAQRINTIAGRQKKEIYPWFPLVKVFFQEQKPVLFKR